MEVVVACNKFTWEGRRYFTGVDREARKVTSYGGPDELTGLPEVAMFKILDNLDPASLAKFGATSKGNKNDVSAYLTGTATGKQAAKGISKGKAQHYARRHGRTMTQYDDWSKTTAGHSMVEACFRLERTLTERTQGLLDLLNSIPGMNPDLVSQVAPQLLGHKPSIKKAFWKKAGAVSSRATEKYSKTLQHEDDASENLVNSVRWLHALVMQRETLVLLCLVRDGDVGAAQRLTSNWAHLISSARAAHGKLPWATTKTRTDVAARLDSVEKGFTELVEHVHRMKSAFKEYVAATSGPRRRLLK
jgi:hypothetical protein